MTTSNPVTGLVRLLGCAGVLGAASLAIVASVGVDQQAARPGGTIQFRAEQIAGDFGIGYAVTTGDVNGDGRTDVVAINATDLVWFEAPSWQKRVILTGATPRDNVCLAVHDVDRDGRLDVALGASWQPTNTSSGGTLHWVRQGAPGADWELHSIAEEPTLHRIRWADVDGDRNKELVVTPLHGRGTKGPDWQGQGARVLVFRPPANPGRDPWPVEVADDTLHIVHNFLPVNLDADTEEEILTASREGVTLLKRRPVKSDVKSDTSDVAWSRTLIGEGAPGEIKIGRVAGRRMLATIEPWHGKSVVIYAEQPGVWARTVIEAELTGGHALGWADFDGDGNDELAVGWRDQKPGVAIYTVDREGALKSKVMVDDGGMATEDLVVADLNGDKQPDIIASGRATRNVKIYWNETRAVPAPPQPATARAPSSQTALDRYVAAPDPNFTWKVARKLPAEGVTATLIEMTSQQWLTDQEVERPLWTHWITIVRPAPASAREPSPAGSGEATSDIGLLFISGGSNDRQPPTRPAAWLVEAARDTGTVTAELRLVPNQPVIFKDDPSRTPRSEDDFIAYTWDKFLRTGDEKWPARLPMTKSAVRAMDAVTAFAATPAGGGKPVTRFVVSGASKRGWTTWTTAATDRRVIAIAPAVIDMLNVEPSFIHHWRAYGAWSDAVKDYVERGIMDWMGTREFRALMRIEEPYEYRDRLTMPKFLLNASGDQFFLPDSSRFYFDDLRGEKYLRYVPNTSHSLDKTDALESLQAFYTTIVKGTPRPELTWTFERDGSIKVLTKDRPEEVLVWQAVNPAARDFRHDIIGSAYRSTPLTPSGPNTYVARVPPPAAGWTAFFVELKFPSGGKYPLKFTTAVRVLPDTLPYPPPAPRRSSGASARRAQTQGEDAPPSRGGSSGASAGRKSSSAKGVE